MSINKEKFEEHSSKGICDVCGKESDIVVVASSMGPISNGYCLECLEQKLEPYSVMVAYISGAGKFPEDIDEAYQIEIRRILKALNKTEEEFILDVDKALAEYIEYIRIQDSELNL